MDATQEKMSMEKVEAVDVLFPANLITTICASLAATSPLSL